jgi:hypothetical protein
MDPTGSAAILRRGANKPVTYCNNYNNLHFCP